MKVSWDKHINMLSLKWRGKSYSISVASLFQEFVQMRPSCSAPFCNIMFTLAACFLHYGNQSHVPSWIWSFVGCHGFHHSASLVHNSFTIFTSLATEYMQNHSSETLLRSLILGDHRGRSHPWPTAEGAKWDVLSGWERQIAPMYASLCPCMWKTMDTAYL